jgi:hypothetical protein
MTRDQLVRGAMLCLLVAATLYTVERLAIWYAWSRVAAAYYASPAPPAVMERSYPPPSFSWANENPFVWVFVLLAVAAVFILRVAPVKTSAGKPGGNPKEERD